MGSIVTVIPYVDKIYCPTYLGQLVTYQQRHSNHGHLREININYTRHELQQLVKEQYFSYDLVLLMDSDVIATKEQLIALLDNFNGSPLALKTKTFNTDSHICCACCLIRMDDYLSLKYIEEFIDECQCSKIMRSFNVAYLEGYQAHEYKECSVQSNVLHNTIIHDYLELKNTTV